MTLEPISSFVVSGVVDRALELFGRRVVQRWSDHRARSFVDQFISAIASQTEPPPNRDELAAQLAEIVEDERKTSALYDAFRYVVLSASREIGPRVIALHMAEAVAGLIDDDEISDAVMLAAAALLDREFHEFMSFAASNGVIDASFLTSSEESAVIKLNPVDFDSNWSGVRQSTGPINLRMEVGSWAQKFAQVGLVIQEISEEEVDYRADSELHIDEPGRIRRVHRAIELREGTSHLLRLTRIATRAVAPGEN